jgi:methylenetetrahydrofolate reductase (NADPH)
MRIDEARRRLAAEAPSISFEFFPPKTEKGFGLLRETIAKLQPLSPTYVSVTYGAGGSTRARTIELVGQIQNELGLTAMAHLTCVGHTRQELGEILDRLWESGVRNVLALRGDPPSGERWFTPREGGCQSSTELVSLVKDRHDFFVAVAGYPEGHPECLNRTRDLEHLKQKVDAGADQVITQLFFDNVDFYGWRERCRSLGILVPIVAGIMPIQNVGQIKRFVTMCGAKIPQPLLVKLEALESDPSAVERAGIAYATRQCQDLIFSGVDGLHFYTLNKSSATVEIFKNLDLPAPAAATSSSR